MTDLPAKIRQWIATSSPKQKLLASLATLSLLATAALINMVGASSVSQDPLDSTPFYFLSAFVKLIVVLLLILGSAVIFKRWSQANPLTKNTRQLHLVESIRLSPKQALHLVVIGDQKLLIGATDQSIALIAPIEGDPSLPEQETQPATSLDFGSVMRSFNIPALNAHSKE